VLKCLWPAAWLLLIGSLSAQIPSWELTSPPTSKVPIRRVMFENARLLSIRDHQQIIRALREERIATGSREQDLASVADEAAERVRAVYRDEGYFKVQVTAKAVRVAGSGVRYDILLRVLEEGKQYRLGDLHIIHVTAFSEQRLRDLFPIRHREIFGRAKIVDGLENLRRLYGSQGYLNFTPIPNTSFNEDNATVDLEVDVDEGRQFRWGNLHVDGMRDLDREVLLQFWEGLRGHLYTFDNQELDRFLRKFFYALRKGTSLADCAFKKVDEREGTVDVYLNLIWNPDLIKQVAKTDGVVR